jgi:xylan 1,4-beta-xylosidase
MTRALTRLLFILCIAVATLALCSHIFAQGAAAPPASPASAPTLGKSLRYCNPLSIETSSQNGGSQGVSLGDVTVIKENNKYYMYCTGGGAWVSDNLVNWKYQRAVFRSGNLPVAPHVVKYNGQFYCSGNDAPLYRAPDPLGPFELVGQWMDEKGQNWRGAFDVDIFIDDDNKPYLYYSARSINGIYGVPLNPDKPNVFAAAPTHLFAFDKSHIWERYGDMNEYSEVTWIEGPWMFKRNGTYYLEYSASGTQWISYATGVYTGKSPLGPFKYAPVNPVLRQTTGVVTGPAHGSVVEGADGNFWQFSTLVMNTPPGGRRLAMDPIGFDKDGNMFVPKVSDTPQWGPGAVADPARNGDSGSIPLTVNKLRVMRARSSVSSQRPGRDAAYATDNWNGTWWEPAEDDSQPTLTLDLGPATESDPVQQFTIDSCRIMFSTGSGFGGGRGGGAAGRGARGAAAGGPAVGGPATGVPAAGGPVAPGQAPVQPAAPTAIAFQYKLDASSDGTAYKTVLDKTDNKITKYIEYDEIPPTACRFVRLTITGWPRVGTNPLGIVEFTVFGKPIEPPKP